MSVKNLFAEVDRAMAKHITCPRYILEARKAIAIQEEIREISKSLACIARDEMKKQYETQMNAEKEIRHMQTLIAEYEKDSGVRS